MLSNLPISASHEAIVRLCHQKRLPAASPAGFATRCNRLEASCTRYSGNGKRSLSAAGAACTALKPDTSSAVTLSPPEFSATPSDAAPRCAGEEVSRPLRYYQTEEKAERDPGSLTADELRLLVRGLPRHYRHKHVPPQFVEEAFDGGMLTLHELARTNGIDLNRAVKYIGENGQLLKALRLTNYLVLTGKANQHTLIAFFQACDSVNRPMVVARVWEMWMQKGVVGQKSAGAAIDCVVSYDPDAALDMLERMQELGVDVHINSYHQVLKGLSDSGRLQNGIQLFGTMRRLDSPVEPNVVTLQHVLTLINSCRAWEHADDVYRYMIRKGMTPDGQLSATFMKVFCAAMQVHTAEVIFRSKLKQWGVQPDRYHFNALLSAHARQGDLDSVRGLLREMEMKRVGPDEHTLVFVLTAAARSRGTALAHVEAVLELARRHGLRRNAYVCAALIQAYRNCLEVSPAQRQQLGEAVLHDMEAAGVRANGVLLNSLLALFWETFEYRKARLLYDRMLEVGVMPNDRTCHIMVQMCEEAGWLEEASGFHQLRRTMRELESTRTAAWNQAGMEVLDMGDKEGTDSQ
eukprot:jgi/Ulvmu1/7905/UM004_0137.1